MSEAKLLVSAEVAMKRFGDAGVWTEEEQVDEHHDWTLIVLLLLIRLATTLTLALITLFRVVTAGKCLVLFAFNYIYTRF